MAESPSSAAPAQQSPHAPPSPHGGPAVSGGSNGSTFASRVRYTMKNHGRKIFFGTFLLYSAANFYVNYRQQKIRDTIPPNTVLHWKITDGSIVETTTDKGYVRKFMKAATADGTPSPTVSLIDVVKAIKSAKDDPRIVGIMANFSTGDASQQTTQPGLGLAQIQELQEFKEAKAKALGGEDKVSLVAFTDSFNNQSQYYLASAFDKVYIQPTGSLPLVGLSSQVPFFKTLLSRLGIVVRAEARKEYKSMVSPFTETELPLPQKQNLFDLIKGLNHQVLQEIAKTRRNQLGGLDPLDKLIHLTQIGPFMATEAKDEGLVDGLLYKRDCGKMVENNGAFGMAHYMRVKAKEEKDALTKSGKPSTVVGLVYLIGGIKRGGGDFGANTIVKAIREAANDKTVDAVVLRIDSGGGDVVASDTIGDAIRWCQEEKRKPVIVSFGNTSASGGYFVSTHATSIVAQPTTITGSIGVASLRPWFTPEFFKMIGVSVEQFFTGSSDNSVLNDLEGAALARYKRQVTALYDDFVKRVAEGRKMTIEQVEDVAGGRVMTGKDALKAGLVDVMGGIYDACKLASQIGLEVHKQSGRLPEDFECDEMVIKVFPTPKPLVQQLIESMTGDEAVDMFAKERIQSLVFQAMRSAFTELLTDFGVSDLSAFMPTQPQLEMENINVQ
ncbi:hypothetical protein BGW41_005070 [Actinomortierella wolfii]|nr:hypothetical protein BGW41_005070 [Actinomortierella wolfii]